MKVKVLGSVWFTEMSSYRPIGIVIVDTGFEEKAYIGTGEGDNEKVDELLIAEYGAKFPLELAKRMI
jgi:hypothetical protein